MTNLKLKIAFIFFTLFAVNTGNAGPFREIKQRIRDKESMKFRKEIRDFLPSHTYEVIGKTIVRGSARFTPVRVLLNSGTWDESACKTNFEETIFVGGNPNIYTVYTYPCSEFFD